MAAGRSPRLAPGARPCAHLPSSRPSPARRLPRKGGGRYIAAADPGTLMPLGDAMPTRYDEAYARSMQDPEGFWAEAAQGVRRARAGGGGGGGGRAAPATCAVRAAA